MTNMYHEERAGDTAQAAHLLGRPLAFRRALGGGEHARTFVAGDGDLEVVVRRFPPGDHAGIHEQRLVPVLRPLGRLVPTVLAVDDNPARGVLVITELVDGGPPHSFVDHDLAAGLATALATIHTLNDSGLRRVPERAPQGPGPAALAARSRFDGLELGEPVLTHYDFWTGNTLWQRDHLVSVVDWSGARRGPRGIDLAWARLDLVLQGRLTAARLILEKYRDVSGDAMSDIWDWDLQAAAQAEQVVGTWAPNYLGVGLPGLTSHLLEERLSAWVDDLLQANTDPLAHSATGALPRQSRREPAPPSRL